MNHPSIHDLLKRVRTAKVRRKTSLTLDKDGFDKFQRYCKDFGLSQSHVIDILIQDFNKLVEDEEE